MTMIQYATLYEHSPSDFSPIDMAVVVPGSTPVAQDWTPAYRDTMGGHRVVWVRSVLVEGDVWVRDHMGVRKVKLYR
jgi:hypothetical protein